MANPNELNVFISCPGDVNDEKQELEKFIKLLSKETEKKYHIKLIPISWQEDAPRGPGRPQKSTNELVDECDIYIGIMGKLFGSSTGVFQSGTNEEYGRAFQRWEKEQLPQMRFFFKEVSISMDAPEEDFEQAKLIRQFKKTIAPHFFYDTFVDSADLVEKAKKELGKIVKNWQPQPEPERAEEIPVQDKDILVVYGEFLNTQYATIRIFQDKSFKLDDIYVSLKLEHNPELWHQMGEAEFRRKWPTKDLSERVMEVMQPELLEAKLRKKGGSSSEDYQKDLTIDQIIDGVDQAVILGEAGSGKTTLFKHLVAKYKELDKTYIPIYLPIRHWKQSGFGDLIQAFIRMLRERHLPFDLQYIEQLKNKLHVLWLQGKLMLLLDGLDEISQDEFKKACENLNKFDHQGNKILVSCRRSSFSPILKGDTWWIYSINPFSKEDRLQFMQKYFNDNKTAERLAGLVEGRTRLRSLGQNPLLMGLLCYIYEKSEGGLPEERVVLYERCVDELLKRRTEQQFSGLSDFKKEFLRVLAYQFFLNKREWFQGDEIRRMLRELIQSRPDLAAELTVDKREAFLQELVMVNSLLLPIGADSHCFPHRSIQEYFAACYLNKAKDGLNQIITTLCQDDFWTETICLYAGIQTNATALVNELGKQKKVQLALRVIPDAVRIDWDKLDKQTLNWKIRRGAVEQFVLPEPNRSRLEETTDILRGILTGRQCDPNANVRYSALIALEKLGTDAAQQIVSDTHIIPPDALVHQKPYTFTARGKEFQINQPGMPANMVHVPGGSFKMGERGEKVTVKDFFMSIFPVTNREYRKFIEAKGYQNKAYWSKEGWKWKKQENWKEPRFWDDEKFNHDWQPVVGVSWYEAEAYCNWLTEFTNAKKPFRLPTEEEWEHAARGSQGDAWAFEGDWNDDIPRWDSYWDYEKGLTYGTARVDTVYKDAVSGFGIFDLSGNVWEWTDNWYDKEHKYRVLRGGSWLNGDGGGLRAASRNGGRPVGRNYDGGFRCLQGSP